MLSFYVSLVETEEKSLVEELYIKYEQDIKLTDKDTYDKINALI